jgi:RNA polymerase sigma-70 factor (ECF subfamily)
MMQTVWHVLGDAHDAEDALQDALTVIVKRFRRVAKHKNPHALIAKICAECAYDHLRRKLRDSRRHRSLDELDQASCDGGPSEKLSQQEMRQDIMSAISKLSRNQAVAFLLRCIQEQSYDDIAAALGCSVVTARKHVGRARQRLSVFLHQLAPYKGTAP